MVMIIQAALLIPLTMTLTVHLLVLLFSSGAGAQNGWGVTYNPTSICAVKGSTVTISCTYTYPSGYSVKKAFWFKQWPVAGKEPPDLLDDPDYRGRVQYLRDKQHNDTLRLQNVTEKDQIKYYFRFLTHSPNEKYTGTPGVDLKVTGLQVEVPERVMEGDKVTLTCKTTCSPTVRPTFTWYRDGQKLYSSTDQLLHLQPVSREDAGRYRCAVLDQNSSEVTLNVSYGPKSVSVSISPSGEIVEGSSVTLTCSSDADPPVNCTWFKETSLVVRGETYTLKVSSVDSGVYRCRCSNEHGEKYSEAVSLNVLYPPKNISVSISPSGKIVEGSSVTLTCSSDANPPVQSYTWFKKLDKEALLKSTSQNYSISNISSADSGEYQCMAKNTRGSRSSEYKTLTVFYAPKKVQVSISKTAELTCSSDANPPVQNYTWYKEGGDSPVGTGHSYSPPQSGSYYCVAQNEYGSQKSAAVTVKGNTVLYAVIGVGVGVGCVSVIIAVVCLRKKQRGTSADGANQTQKNLYSSVTERSTMGGATPPDPDPSNQDNVYYASVKHHRVNNPGNAESSAGTASALNTNEDVQYASVCFTHTGATNRSATSTLGDDSSVIYSSVR